MYELDGNKLVIETILMQTITSQNKHLVCDDRVILKYVQRALNEDNSFYKAHISRLVGDEPGYIVRLHFLYYNGETIDHIQSWLQSLQVDFGDDVVTSQIIEDYQSEKRFPTYIGEIVFKIKTILAFRH